jgi:hypothetical protein
MLRQKYKDLVNKYKDKKTLSDLYKNHISFIVSWYRYIETPSVNMKENSTLNYVEDETQCH